MQIHRRVPTFVSVSDLSPVYFVSNKEVKTSSIMLLEIICGDGRKKGNVNSCHKKVTDGQTDRCSIHNDADTFMNFTTRSDQGKLHYAIMVRKLSARGASSIRE